MGRRKIELARHDVAESKQAAIEAGKRAYVGEACSLGHTTRWTSNGMCVECVRQRNAIKAEARQVERNQQANDALARQEWKARADGLEHGRAYLRLADDGAYIRSAHVETLYLQHEPCKACGSRVRYTRSEACGQCGEADEIARRRAIKRAQMRRYRQARAPKPVAGFRPRADLLDL